MFFESCDILKQTDSLIIWTLHGYWIYTPSSLLTSLLDAVPS